MFLWRSFFGGISPVTKVQWENSPKWKEKGVNHLSVHKLMYTCHKFLHRDLRVFLLALLKKVKLMWLLCVTDIDIVSCFFVSLSLSLSLLFLLLLLLLEFIYTRAHLKRNILHHRSRTLGGSSGIEGNLAFSVLCLSTHPTALASPCCLSLCYY